MAKVLVGVGEAGRRGLARQNSGGDGWSRRGNFQVNGSEKELAMRSCKGARSQRVRGFRQEAESRTGDRSETSSNSGQGSDVGRKVPTGAQTSGTAAKREASTASSRVTKG